MSSPCYMGNISGNKRNKKIFSILKMELLLTCIFILLSCSSARALDSQNSSHKIYFENIDFNLVTRAMKITNSKGEAVINARLGTTFNKIDAQPCPTKNQIPGHICLEWEHKARLYISAYEPNSELKCYYFMWNGLADTNKLIDCFEFYDKEHWYGGGQNAQSSWHLDKGSHEFSPFITGRIGEHQWGNVLKRYFISSRGAALLIDDFSPLSTSLNGNNKKQFCLKSQYDDFAFVKHVSEYVEFNYTICTSSNSAILHSKLIENVILDGLKKRDFENIETLINEPIWEITADATELNEEKISNFTTDIITLGFLKQGHILINEFWQKQIGDFTVDLERFPHLEDSIHVFHRRGFKIVISIQLFISTESSSFTEAVKKELFISERSCDHRIPALTRYKSLQTAGMLDTTKIDTHSWLLEKLKNLSQKYNIDSFYLDTGIAYDTPHYFQNSRDLVNPDHYLNPFINSLSGVNLFGVSSAIKRSTLPTLVTLPELESSWIGIRKVIPLVLTYGLLGYPLFVPAAVGGDFKINNHKNQTVPMKLLPDKDLYVRWLQIASFLPVMKFNYLPSSYGDERIIEIVRNFTKFRESKISPLLHKYSKEALDTALPIIRPLWMIDANDLACHEVDDQFSIGDELIVAPILYSSGKLRDVYLPTGIWKDGIDGSFHKGGQWIKNYTVEEHQIAFFEKTPSPMNI